MNTRQYKTLDDLEKVASQHNTPYENEMATWILKLIAVARAARDCMEHCAQGLGEEDWIVFKDQFETLAEALAALED